MYSLKGKFRKYKQWRKNSLCGAISAKQAQVRKARGTNYPEHRGSVRASHPAIPVLILLTACNKLIPKWYIFPREPVVLNLFGASALWVDKKLRNEKITLAASVHYSRSCLWLAFHFRQSAWSSTSVSSSTSSPWRCPSHRCACWALATAPWLSPSKGCWTIHRLEPEFAPWTRAIRAQIQAFEGGGL